MQRMMDGAPQVRHTHVRHDGAIHKFHHRVDDGLGMDDDLDFLRGQAEEVVQLDYFESLVH
jgi:hypothetical protein